MAPETADGLAELRASLEQTDAGRLSLNGQEMILLPRHFFRAIVEQVERAGGPELVERVLEPAGHHGALLFCRRFRDWHGCSPAEAVRGYFAEMSLRGWGRFSVERLDPDRGVLVVSLERSALSEADRGSPGHVVWRGAVVGSLAFLQECHGAGGSEPRVEYEESGGGCRVRVESPPGSGEGSLP